MKSRHREIWCLAIAWSPAVRGFIPYSPIRTGRSPAAGGPEGRQSGPSGNITVVVYGAMHPVPVTLAPSAIHQTVTGHARPTTAAGLSRHLRSRLMSDFVPGLEGVVAFETEIAEPDKEGGALRYRGVDIEELVGQVSFGNVWGLLVDGKFNPGLPPAEPFPIAGPLRRHPGRRAVRARDARAGLGPRSRCSTSPTSRPATTSPAPPSWRCPSSRSPPAASACRWSRRARSTRPRRSSSGS